MATIHRFQLTLLQSILLMAYGFGMMFFTVFSNLAGWVIMIIAIILFSGNLQFGKIFTIAFIILLIGYIFKIQHWKGSAILIETGMLVFAIAAFFKFIYKTYKLNLILLYISCLIIAVAILLKLFHYPYQFEFFITGFSLLLISYFFRFLLKSDKNFEDYNKLLLVIFWSAAAVFNIFHWIGGNFLTVLTAIIFWAWLIYSLARELKKKKTSRLQI